MRACWSLLAFSLLLPLCPSANADSAQQPLSLDNYRVKAALPAVCTQVGGTLVYGPGTPDCKLPTVTSKVPSATATPSHALPMTAKH